MLRFFRQIRKGLLTDHKFSRYLLYAVGEILLVVIGILIALQVNNWNEAKLTKKALTAALKEIREDLVIDTLHLNNVIEIRVADLESQRRTIRTLEERQSFSEQTYRDLGRVMLQRQTKLLSNGYELIHELGISKLNSKELRNNLIEYYEWVQSWIEKEITDDTNEFESTWLPYVREHFRDWEFGHIGIPINDQELAEDSYFLISLKINQNNLRSTLEAHEYALKRARDLIETIDAYIPQ